MAAFDIVCQDCGEHFVGGSKLALYCHVCRNKRNDESKRRSQRRNKKKEVQTKTAVPEKPKQPEKHSYSFQQVKCPDDCVYYQTLEGKRQMCGFFLTTNERRGCDPGPGCKRYAAMKSGPKHRRTKWDVVAGKKLWEAGWKDSMIAKAMKVKPECVKSYRRRVWEKEKQ